MTYASVDDIVVEVGRPADSPEQAAQWQSWLETVERSIRRRFKQSGMELDEQVQQGEPTPNEVIDVEVSVVARRIRWESQGLVGLTSITTSVDDASRTERRDGVDVSADLLAITDAEWAALLPESAGGAFPTRLAYEPDNRGWRDLW